MDVAQLVNDLNSAEVGTRRRAAEALAQSANIESAAVALVRAAGDADEEVMEWAHAALEGMGAPSAHDAMALAELLQDASATTGYWAATLLGRLEANAAAAVKPLADTLASATDTSVRQRCAWALGEIGPPAKAALPALTSAAAASDRRLVRLALEAMERIMQ